MKAKTRHRMKDTRRGKSLWMPFKRRQKDTKRKEFLLKPFEASSKGDLIAGALSVAIIIASTIIVVNTINPLIDEGKTTQAFNDARQTLTSLDATINEIMLEAPGSKRSINVNLRGGKMTVSGKDDKIRVRIDDIDLLESGITVEEGNILITGGAKITSYESDIEGDGDTDLVLENAAIIFAVQKTGSPTNYAAINTTTFITQIKNVRTRMNITPASGIFVNDQVNTSYGTGYTELTQTTDADSKGIRAFVNSASGMQYEALFTLQAAKDFVELQVKRVV
ncbi:MAG: hypothetical protein HYW27_00270 [Candidatus Aenigmarchaeota archaeon]|nr:hypothetical protein [Candidatus Aenigmarchaeota archaeon]